MFSRLTKSNIITLLVSGGIAIITAAMVVWLTPLIPRESIKSLANTLLSTISAACLVNVIWEILAKRSFADTILELAKISEVIKTSGIDYVDDNFQSISWQDELQHTKNLTVVLTYGATWRRHNAAYLKKFAENTQNNLVIILPDPAKEEIMSEFDRRFNYPAGKTAQLISDAIKEFNEIGAKVYLYPDSLYASYYLLDNSAIMSFFKHTKARSEVPYLHLDSTGSLFTYVKKEVDFIFSQATPMPLDNELTEEKNV